MTKTKEAYRIKGRQKTSKQGSMPRRAVACALQSRFAHLRVTRVMYGRPLSAKAFWVLANGSGSSHVYGPREAAIDRGQHVPIDDASSHRFEEVGMRDRVEVFRQISVNNVRVAPALAKADVRPDPVVLEGPKHKVAAIGIGGSLAAPPLPHHRAYGSVHGGSRSCANTIGTRMAGRAI